MKISHLISLIIATLLLTGCGGGDSGGDGGSIGTHYQGFNCAQCHNGTVAEARVFTSGGTIFSDLNATNSTLKVATNYSLRLLLENNATVNYGIGRGSGNANVTIFQAIGALKYTAQVLNAQGVVNSSIKNSHDATRFDCNRCHVVGGAGVPKAPGRIVSYDYYNSLRQPTTGGTTPTTGGTTPTTGGTKAVVISFAKDVYPILTKLYCIGCHGATPYPNPSTTGTPNTFSIKSQATAYTEVKRFVQVGSPTTSRLIQKGSGTITHFGGKILKTSNGLTTISDWITQGAKNN